MHNNTVLKRDTQFMQSRPWHLLAVDLEPAPYKVDLWNAFAASDAWQVEVLYTNAKDVSKDAGHDYQEWPQSHFAYEVLSGHSFFASIAKIRKTIAAVMQKKIDLVWISGYVNAAPLAAILTCVVMQKSFCVHSDIFNLQHPRGSFAGFKRWMRDRIRAIVFQHAKGVLVCGKLGLESAQLAGCPLSKIIDFPYVVNVDRLRKEVPSTIPADLSKDVQDGDTRFYFSGRMIERKGLDTLLQALAQIERSKECNGCNWVLWIAGDGPLLGHYQALANTLGVAKRVRFLGFVQMTLHSWLLRHTDIVIVPSISDAWGIVVDEAMQLGKTVIASTGVGSAIDRVDVGVNGELFAAGNVEQLRASIAKCMQSTALRHTLGQHALAKALAYSPERNVASLTALMNH